MPDKILYIQTKQQASDTINSGVFRVGNAQNIVAPLSLDYAVISFSDMPNPLLIKVDSIIRKSTILSDPDVSSRADETDFISWISMLNFNQYSWLEPEHRDRFLTFDGEDNYFINNEEAFGETLDPDSLIYLTVEKKEKPKRKPRRSTVKEDPEDFVFPVKEDLEVYKPTVSLPDVKKQLAASLGIPERCITIKIKF